MDPARLNIVLYQPEIPQNTGNIGRTCVAVAAKLWVVRPTAFRLDDHHLRRAGLDYWQYLNWQDVNDFAALPPHRDESRTFFYTKTARCSYTDIAYQPGDFLVFGSETRGLPRSLLEQHAEQCVRIPMSAQVRSLNLSNAVAIAAYEALRQWGELLAPGATVSR